MDARELALDDARELGRELAGKRLMALDVRSRASSETSEAALDGGIFCANRPLESRGRDAGSWLFLILSSADMLADTPRRMNDISNQQHICPRPPSRAQLMSYGIGEEPIPVLLGILPRIC